MRKRTVSPFRPCSPRGAPVSLAQWRRGRLLAAFRRTDYRLLPGDGVAPGLIIRPGGRHPAVDRLLRLLAPVPPSSLVWAKRLRSPLWAVLTPCNPGAMLLPAGENEARLQGFARDLAAWGIPHWPTINAALAGWPAEPGFLVFPLTLCRLQGLLARWGQLAAVVGRPGGRARLVWAHAHPGRRGG